MMPLRKKLKTMASSGSSQTSYSICGFDIGSENCYIAVAQGGGIEILLNDYSQRSTPAYVALGDKQRELGVSAKQKQLMNLQSTYINMKRIVGRQYNDVMKNEQLPYPVQQGEDGDLVVEITHNNEDYKFTMTQLLAMVFTKLRQIAGNSVDCVINCPNYFNDAQKRAMLDAAQIAGLNPLRVLPDLTAIGVLYGFYRTSSGADSTVAFVDLGQTTTQCSVVYYKNKQSSSMHVLAVESDGGVGGKNFDEVLANHFINSNNLGNLNKRGKCRLVAECERLKKQMSANSTKIPMNVECLTEDRDFSSSSCREEFETLAGDYFKRIETMLRSVFEKAHEKFLLNQKGEEKPVDFKIDAVELLGGGSRIPAIKNMVKDIFGVEPTTTMNADEAVARGCALQCAMLSPTFKVGREMVVHDYNMYNINCKYYFEAEAEKITEMKSVFAKGTPFPFTRKLTLSCSSLPLILEFDYENESGHTASIGQWKVTTSQPLTLQKNKLVVYIKLDHNGLASVSSANVAIEDTSAGQTTEDIPQAMETDQKETGAEKGEAADGDKKVKVVNVQLNVQALWIRGTLTEEELQQFKKIESDLILADKNWKERIDAKNELEEYVYEWRDKLENGSYDPFVEPNEKKEFANELSAMQSWLYADEETGEIQNKSVYTDKVNALKSKYSDGIRFRESEFSSREQYLERLGKAIQLGGKVLETDEKVDETKLEKLRTELADKQRWNDESHSVITNTPLHVNPTITTKHIMEQIEHLERATKAVMDEIQRKRQEKQREEEKKRKEEEDKKKQAEAQQNAGDQNNASPPGDGQQQPMDVDGQPQNPQ
ncbi:Heat shock -like protein [Halotydeus destructor]|nr:Heat shock -like protein [Halotydeus destructor]